MTHTYSIGLERGFAGWRFVPLQEWQDKNRADETETVIKEKEMVTT